jgi:hypothetical protein
VVRSGSSDAVRFAERVVTEPGNAVARWRAFTGRKAVGCFPPNPVPEILHAAGFLNVPCHSPWIPPGLSREIDAWVLYPDGPAPMPLERKKPGFGFPPIPPSEIAEALDLLEEFAEWAGTLSGHPVREGDLAKSLQAFRERRDMLFLLHARYGAEAGFLSPGEMQNLSRAGDYLPPESHSLLLARALDLVVPTQLPGEEGEAGGDLLLALARRLMAGKRGMGQ